MKRLRSAVGLVGAWMLLTGLVVLRPLPFQPLPFPELHPTETQEEPLAPTQPSSSLRDELEAALQAQFLLAISA